MNTWTVKTAFHSGLLMLALAGSFAVNFGERQGQIITLTERTSFSASCSNVREQVQPSDTTTIASGLLRSVRGNLSAAHAALDSGGEWVSINVEDSYWRQAERTTLRHGTELEHRDAAARLNDNDWDCPPSLGPCVDGSCCFWKASHACPGATQYAIRQRYKTQQDIGADMVDVRCWTLIQLNYTW
jgi:hypothetical protein